MPETGNRVVLEPEDFYLLLSAEAVRVPPEYAAEMTAFDPAGGEVRTHYAGFFDPGFGHDRPGCSHRAAARRWRSGRTTCRSRWTTSSACALCASNAWPARRRRSTAPNGARTTRVR